VAATVCVVAAPAQATFPGGNGKIVYAYDDGAGATQIVAINPDGTGQTFLTSGPDRNLAPRWSPDGQKIAFATNRDAIYNIYVMDADGSNETRLTDSTADYGQPQWSADGTKIAFTGNRNGNTDVYVMNADGSNPIRLTTDPALDIHPSFSPNGGRIVFHRYDDSVFPPITEVYAIDTDGSDLTLLTGSNNRDGATPDWSPDGSKIAFVSRTTGSFGPYHLWTMNPDGSGQQQIIPSSDMTHYFREWAPVGDRLLLHISSDTYSARRDGTDLRQLTNDLPIVQADERWSPDAQYITGFNQTCPGDPELPCDPPLLFVMRSDGSGMNEIATGSKPDWQPIPLSYIRPKAAAPTRVSLVPAYAQCTPPAANRTHGPPLGFPSCASPVPSSSQLTVGTPDANGQTAKSSGLVRYGVQVGNPQTPADEANVRIIASISDVRNTPDLSDYTGELQVDQGLRITDRENTPNPGGPGPGTVSDTSFPVTIPCAATADATIGSTCAIDTTADAIVPNTVKEGRRSVWQIGEVKVYDGGTDGDAETTADNALFMTQGVFIP
jgi:dipeptidyl aminopeptidase/acylaminoacyl peptidase